jgi:hypothetical protein
MVLIDQAAKDGLSPDRTDISQVRDRLRDHRLDRRRSLPPGLVRAVIIVVPGVLSEDLRQMSLIEDQHLIEDLPAQRPDHTLADRVRLNAVTAAWGSRPSRPRLTAPPMKGKAVWFSVPLPQSWAAQSYVIPPGHAANELLLAVSARGIKGSRRSDGKGISVIEFSGLNVWVEKSFSWLDHSGARICHPLIDFHEATDSLIHHLETRLPLM